MVLLIVVLLSVQGVLGLGLSVLPDGIAPQDGTRGHTRGPALPHLVDGSVLSPPRLPVNARLLLVVRNVIAVVPLLAGGGTLQAIVQGHVVGALPTGQADAVEALPFHGVENKASPDLLHRKVGGANEARAIAAAALAADLPLMETTWTLIVVV